jgi:hypothetical protein
MEVKMSKAMLVAMRLPAELLEKTEKLQKKFGVNRTDIVKLLLERITEVQLGLMLGAKQPDPPQAQPSKSSVVSPVLSRSLPRAINPAPKKQAK